jgi:uncharacterized protein YdiU (UPF0061 family)
VGRPDRYLSLLRRVSERQAALIAQWMNVGFIHGVMNTDNMTISGETIDYGPCAFMEAYDPQAVFSSIDQGGRYAYRNQPPIAQWNLARLAEGLLPLMVDSDDEAAANAAVAAATEVIQAVPALFQARYLDGLRTKLGLADARDEDMQLANDFLVLLQAQRVDYTLGWRRLGNAAAGDAAPLEALFADPAPLREWLTRWHARLEGDGVPAQERAQRMDKINPWIIPRNHRVEEALNAASNDDDLGPFNALLAALRDPCTEKPGNAAYAEPAPAEVTACYQTFCGT